MNTLVYTYLNYQVPIWGYIGYKADYALWRHIIANIGALVLSLLTPKRVFGLTSFSLALVASTIVVALLALYAARNYSALYLIAVLVFLLIVKSVAHGLRFRIPQRKNSAKLVILLTSVLYGVSIVWIVSRG
jgi:predicted membrane protein